MFFSQMIFTLEIIINIFKNKEKNETETLCGWPNVKYLLPGPLQKKFTDISLELRLQEKIFLR